MFVRVRARQKDVTGYINCMRGTWLGNPFTVGRYGLKRCLYLFKKYLAWRYETDEIYRRYLDELVEKALTSRLLLGCTCKLDKPCHVDLMIEFMMDKRTVNDNQSEILAFAKEYLNAEKDEFLTVSGTGLKSKRPAGTIIYYKKYKVFSKEEFNTMIEIMQELN